MSSSTGRPAASWHLPLLVAGFVLMWPLAAMACPGCFGQDANKVFDTYFWSTVVLSLLPFGLAAVFGLVVFYFRRLGRRSADAAPGDAIAAPPAVSPPVA